ncbi:MAG: hypothetical protein QOH41_17 [Blastocatellia bacterium]|jgi:hypothetical protein|nr:hypothetical protein [Blastocatellia bacterium]
MSVYIYLRHQDLFDKRSRLSTLKRRLGQFNLSNVLFTLTRINVLLSRQAILRENKEKQQGLQELLISNYLDPDLVEGILKPRFGHFSADERPIFFRQQILNLLRMCILICREDATMTTEGKSRGAYELGRCCLMMNDHLVSAKEERATSTGTDRKQRRHISLQTAPNIELNNPPQAARAIVRAEALFSEILHSDGMSATLKKELPGFDLESAFKAATGLSIDEYKEVVLTMISFVVARTPDEIMNHAGLFRRSEIIKGTRITPDQFAGYLALDSMSLAEAKARFANRTTKLLPQFDYVWFRRWPLLRLDDDILGWADPCFMVERLSSGIYWIIVDSLKGRDKDGALKAFGFLFENYAAEMLQLFPQRDGMFIDQPKYTNGDKSVDGIIHCGDTLIMIESKGSFMDIAAKYSGKIRRFEGDLDKKFGLDPKKGTEKGIAQLAKHIERLFPKQLPLRDHINELDSALLASHSRIEKITPVLIVREPILRFSGVEEMLSDRFLRLLKQRRVSHSVKINPLAVIDIDTLEEMKPNLVAGDFTLQQCLNVRAARDPLYRSSWHDFLVESFPEFATKADEEVNAKFESIMDRGTRNLFGDGISSVQ